MAKQKPQSLGDEHADRLRTAIESDTRFDARKISEILKAFDAKIPPERLAEIMADEIDNPETNKRTRNTYMAFILGLKKFEEKNAPKLDDEEINKLETDQAYAWLRATFMPQFAEVEAERDALLADNAELKEKLSHYENASPVSQEPIGEVRPAV